MNYNYHTHTVRCGHATDGDEAYIQTAIAGGIKYMGFSDHFPFAFPDGYESPFRVPVAEAKAYVADISALAQRYKEQIDIKIGFEMEYYPSHFETMLQKAIEYGAEYLIQGQHFLYGEHPNGVSSFRDNSDPKALDEYVSCVVSGIRSGVFSYVAHPDMYRFVGSRDLYQQEMRKICVAARECDIPLEINFLGIRTNRSYPNEAFWEIAGQERSPVTFGLDAHQSVDAADPESYKKAMELVARYDLNYIGKPKLINIQRLKK